MIMESFPICMVAMEMGGWRERGEGEGSPSLPRAPPLPHMGWERWVWRHPGFCGVTEG